jgi:hypothetical protein
MATTHPARAGQHPARPPRNPHLPDEGLSVPEDAMPPAGHAPPAESGVSSLGVPEREALRHGWAGWPVALIAVVVALFAAGALGQAVELMR